MTSPPPSSQGQEGKEQQLLLEMAERVITACDVDASCMTTCQNVKVYVMILCVALMKVRMGMDVKMMLVGLCHVCWMRCFGDGYSFRWNGGG